MATTAGTAAVDDVKAAQRARIGELAAADAAPEADRSAAPAASGAAVVVAAAAAEEDGDQPARPSPISILWPAYFSAFVDFVGQALTFPVQPFLADEMGASPAMISALFGAYSVGMFIGATAMGRLSDRVGRKPVIIFSLVASTIAYVIAGLANDLSVLFISRVLGGLCGGTLPVAQAMILDVTTEEERPLYLALGGAAYGLGFVVGPAIGAVAVGPLGVGGCYFVCAAVSLVGLGVSKNDEFCINDEKLCITN